MSRALISMNCAVFDLIRRTIHDILANISHIFFIQFYLNLATVLSQLFSLNRVFIFPLICTSFFISKNKK